MKFGRNVVKEETTQKNYQDEDKKSAKDKKKKLILRYKKTLCQILPDERHG